MQAPRSDPDDEPITGLEVLHASTADSWAEPDGPAPPRPKNRVVRTGMIICACGFLIAILGVAQLAEQKNHATALAHYTHKTGLLTMFTGFMAMLFGFRSTRIRNHAARSSQHQALGDSITNSAKRDWSDTPWRTS
jgi:uncharacterized membrane protein